MQYALLEIGNIQEKNYILDLIKSKGIKSKILDSNESEDLALGMIIDQTDDISVIDEDNESKLVTSSKFMKE